MSWRTAPNENHVWQSNTILLCPSKNVFWGIRFSWHWRPRLRHVNLPNQFFKAYREHSHHCHRESKYIFYIYRYIVYLSYFSQMKKVAAQWLSEWHWCGWDMGEQWTSYFLKVFGRTQNQQTEGAGANRNPPDRAWRQIMYMPSSSSRSFHQNLGLKRLMQPG